MKEQAKAEGKTPVLAFLDLGRPGFLIVIHSDDFDAVMGAYCKTRPRIVIEAAPFKLEA